MADGRSSAQLRLFDPMLRLAAALACIGVVLVGACAPVTIPAGPPMEQPHLDFGTAVAPETPANPSVDSTADPVFGTLITADNVRLPMRAWLPKDAPLKAVILAVHGFNDYSNAFDMPGRWWARHGIATYAYDQRGFGAAPNTGYWAGTATMADDLAEASRLLTARYPGVPLYYLGESMGAAVTMAALARGTVPPPAGVILAAPAVWSRSYMPFYQRWALWTVVHTMPWLTFTGRGLGIMPSDNIEMLRALGRDPLIIKETRTDTIKGLVDLMDEGFTATAQLPGPALILVGAHDQVVPIKPQFAAVSTLPDPAHQRLAFYPNGWHMVLRDLEGATVWADVAAWIAQHNATLPSGADADAMAKLKERAERP
jgi:alpha-beta hydrolase superfamily lysophospholipase